MSQEGTDAADWAHRYEQLRGLAVDGATSAGRRGGLALVMRQGLVAWMRAWPRRTEAPRARQQLPCSAVPAIATDAGPLVAVLAGMIFNARQEVDA